MVTKHMEDWHEANQRYLMAAFGVMRAHLESSGDSSDVEEARGKLEEAAVALPAPSALETLSNAFGLSGFERQVLVLCAGVELDGAFSTVCASAQGEARHAYPSFSLALARLPDSHWSALTPEAPLRQWRLIEVGSGEGLTSALLRIDERILHYLTGISSLDDRLRGLVFPVTAGAELVPSQARVAQKVVELWGRRHEEPLSRTQILLCGNDLEAKRGIARAACRSLGLDTHTMRAGDIPAQAAEREALIRLWEREAVLMGSALLLDAEEIETPGPTVSFVDRIRSPLLIMLREPKRLGRGSAIRLEVTKPTVDEQSDLWNRALGPLAAKMNGDIEMVVSHFSMGVDGIHSTGERLRNEAPDADGTESERLWQACRVQARARLEDLAGRIESPMIWDDLIVPDSSRQILGDIAAHLRQRSRVYEGWGFASKTGRGLGLNALFYGASGTGKTMAAEVIANELQLDLFRIDLSSLVSKYIGETEKNLRRVFDAAEEGGAILLFDEADALFGKRSEVKDSHDRYANIEVSYLLQRMEAYRGLAILTTNMKNVLDPAFLRRIRFVVQFPFPDAAQRAEIWRRIFPDATPTKGLDPEKLARLNVAGGNIRNIALNAAFLAADQGKSVQMTHLLRAARSEYAKLERPLADVEVRGWK